MSLSLSGTPQVPPPALLPLSLRNEGKPGFIKRADNYVEVRLKVGRFRGTDYPKVMILAAVRSIRGLTRAEEKVLSEAVDIVPAEDYKTGVGGVVWARKKVFAERCDLSLDAVKTARRGLERKGYALRHPDGDNNQMRFDIRPFLAELDRHIEHRAAIDEARYRQDEMGQSFPTIENGSCTPQGVKISPHIQSSKTNPVDTVPQGTPCDQESPLAGDQSIWESEATPGHSEGRRQYGDDNHGNTTSNPPSQTFGKTVICSAGRASGTFSGKSRPSMPSEQPLTSLLKAYELSPRWRALVDIKDIHKLAYDRLFIATLALIKAHFPDASRHHDHTWKWAVENHGWRAIIMAIVSLEDPTVRNTAKYFGALVTKADGIDLGQNLGWIVKHREELQRRIECSDTEAADAPPDQEACETPSPEGQEPHQDRTPEEWPAFVEQLRHRAPSAQFRSWYAALSFLALRDGELTLAAPSKFIASYTEANGQRVIAEAGRAVGWRFNMLRVRGPE